jgi:glycosyltransferase involved in cell wall biosynthesis
MEKKIDSLVSMLTPCYNGEKYIWRLLDSVLTQTYSNIQMVIVDDGSTDNSEMVIKEYIKKFEKRGYSLTYVYQKNQGLSSTINNGLKIVTGDYLIWPDIDDWYASDNAISEMVSVLDNSDDSVSMVRCQYHELEEGTLKIVKKNCVNDSTKGKTDLFEDALFLQNGHWLLPGGYMAKLKKIDEVIPGRDIYTERYAGQNWQLQLPLSYNLKVITIEKYLFNYLRRKNSFTRGMYGQLDMYNAFRATVLNTLDRIHSLPEEQKEKYKEKVRIKYNTIFFRIYIESGDFKNAKEILSKFDSIPKKMLIKFWLYQIPYGKNILKAFIR